MTDSLDKELQKSAQKLLDYSHEYYNLMRKKGLAGGCIWLTDIHGAMVIFTRGEYRHQLLHNIEIEMPTRSVYNFGTADPAEKAK